MTPAITLLTLSIYIIILITISWYSSRSAKNVDYFVANRANRWYTAAIAMVGAAMSGITFVSVPGSVAADGFSYMQMVLGFTAGQFVIAFVLIPVFYRLGVVSLYQYLDGRFGIISHKSGAWMFFISRTAIAALRLYVMSIVIQQLLFDHFSIPFYINILLTVSVIWFATRRGGVKSLIWTDSLKTFCLIGALILSIIFIAHAMNWDASDVLIQVSNSEYSTVFNLDDTSSPKYFWKMFFAGLFTLVAMTGLDQDMMQCNLSCVNKKDAQINIVITAISQIFVILLFLILGAMLYIYSNYAGLALPEKGDQLFAFVAFEGGLPIIVGVLFVLGLVASTYASAASSITALTTSLTVDLISSYKELDDDKLTQLRLKNHTIISIVIALLILCVGGLGNESVINTMFKFVGYTYGPILGLFAFGLLTPFKVRDQYVPYVVIISLILSTTIEWTLHHYCGYIIGFELLIYNAIITMMGLTALITNKSGKNAKQ
ncbi:MAG: sodium:solute symporter [Rikenellaceae bacterium]